MDYHLEIEREVRFGELHDSPARGESRVTHIPRFFLYERDDLKGESMATKNKGLASQQQRGVQGSNLQNMDEDGGTGEAQWRTPLENISNNPKQNLSPFGLLVPAPKHAVKNLEKAAPMENAYVKFKNSDSDNGTILQISHCRSKKRRIHSAAVQLPNNKVASGSSGTDIMDIDEIDLPDINNHLAVVEYIKDLYTFYKGQQHVNRPVDYMDRQLDFNENARATAIGWLVKVHYNLRLWPETLYLSVNIINRYLSLEVTPRSQLQLVIICSLLIASKYEENQALKVNDLIQLTRYKYTKEVAIRIEKKILNRLEWYLTVPTTYMFLVRFVKAAMADKELENMIYFFGELGLIEYVMIRYCPCMVAAAAVYAARCTLGKSPLWTDTLRRHTSYSESEIHECAQILAKAHLAAPDSIHKLKVVYSKYKLKEYGRVALYSPAMTLIEEPNSGVSASS